MIWVWKIVHLHLFFVIFCFRKSNRLGSILLLILTHLIKDIIISLPWLTLGVGSPHFWVILLNFMHFEWQISIIYIMLQKGSIAIRSAQPVWLLRHSATHITQIHIYSITSCIIRLLTILIRTLIIIILNHLSFCHSLALHLFIEFLLLLTLDILNEKLKL